MKKILILTTIMIMSLIGVVGCTPSKSDLSIGDIKYEVRENPVYKEYGEIDYKFTLNSSSNKEIYVERYAPILDSKIEKMLQNSANKYLKESIVPNGAELEANFRVKKDPKGDLEDLKKQIGDTDKIIKGFEFVVKVDGKEKTIKVMKK